MVKTIILLFHFLFLHFVIMSNFVPSSLIVFLLLCKGLSSCLAQSCGNYVCPSSNQCCNDQATGYRCYDSSLYQCIANDLGTFTLCGADDDACGTTCYDPTKYLCEAGNVLCGYVQGEAVLACGSSCYNTSVYGCCSSQLFLLSNPPAGCGSATSTGGNPSSSTQALYCSPYNQTACAPGQWCCGATCYDHGATETCIEDVICPAGNYLCAGTDCYNPNAQECCNDQLFDYGTSPCSQDEATCCSCSCSAYSLIYGVPSTTATVSSPGLCSKTGMGWASMDCPSTAHDCYQGSNVLCGTLNCPGEIYMNSCTDFFATPNPYCLGTYICGGGNSTCQILNNGACTSSEGYHNSTDSGHAQTIFQAGGFIEYEPLPVGYDGPVCCWFAAGGADMVGTNVVVPDVASCNVHYVIDNDTVEGDQFITSAPTLFPGWYTTMVWAPVAAGTPSSACGLPIVV